MELPSSRPYIATLQFNPPSPGLRVVFFFFFFKVFEPMATFIGSLTT